MTKTWGVRTDAGGRWSVAVLGSLILAAAMAVPVTAQGLGVGLQASSSQDAGWGGGPRLILDLPVFIVVGSFDLFFPDSETYERAGIPVMAESVDYWEANFNLLYKIGFSLLPLTPYLGGGINIAGLKVEGSPEGQLDVDGTETGVNVLGGLEFKLGSFAPFLEGRHSFGGGDQWVVTFGLTVR